MGDIVKGNLLEGCPQQLKQETSCPIISTTPSSSSSSSKENNIQDGEQIQDQASSSEDDEDGEVEEDEDEEEVEEGEADSSEIDDDVDVDEITSSVDDDEIDQLLEEGLPVSKRLKNKRSEGGDVGGRSELEYNEKEIIVLEERSKNSLEVLPGGWIEVRHSSGMPLYLHRKTRVCTLAKPYFLGPGSARRHSIPLSAIPCLAYRRQMDQEINVVNGFPDMDSMKSDKNIKIDVDADDATTNLTSGGKRKRLEEEEAEEAEEGSIPTNKKHKHFKTDVVNNENISESGPGVRPSSSCCPALNLNSTNVVTSGTSESEVSLEEDIIQSPDRQSLNASREETTISSPEPTYSNNSIITTSLLDQQESSSSSSSVETPPPPPSISNGSTLPNSVSSSSAPGSETNCKSLPIAKVATAKENHSMHSISPEDLREYCKSVFKFKIVKCKRFKTWSARRRHTKEQKRIQLQRPTMPDGVKLISFPIHNNGPPDSGKMNKEYIMNPQGKSSVCILHEYVQHALRKQPSYIFRELENAATPYSATVVINGMQYGTGYGSSKKQAKADAAKTALEILIPQMKEQLNGTKPDPTTDFDVLPFFEPFGLLDTGISKICKNFSEPPPYGLLLTCLQRNFGQDTCNSVKFEMISPGPQSNKFRMVVGEHSVEVQAPNKREGKQLGSQQLLAKLHPNIKNFGSFVKLYGNNSIKSVKEKKQEEQQITTLQSKASANSPNWAILTKLKMEMRKLQDETPKTSVGIRPWPSNVKDTQDLPPLPPPSMDLKVVDESAKNAKQCKLLGEISIGDANANAASSS